MRSAPFPGSVVPDVALTNSGSLRLNYDVKATAQSPTTIHRRLVEETIAFPSQVRLIRVSTSVLEQALKRSVKERGDGAWLQVSGIRFDYDPVSGKVSGIKVLKNGNWEPLKKIKTLLVATINYLIEPIERDSCTKDAKGQLKDQNKCQNGYVMFNQKQLEEPRGYSPFDLKTLMENELQSGPISPVEDGRVCALNDNACLNLR